MQTFFPEMKTKDVSVEIDTIFKELLKLIAAFDQEKINVIPFEGSWSAGQLSNHLIKANSGFVEVLNGPVIDTERKPDQMVDPIKAKFLDFSTKMKSPDFIVPENFIYKKEDLLSALQTIKNNLIEAIDSLDLTKTCVAFEVPVYGNLTRWEAVHFVLYHTQRHIHQLKNIFQKLSGVKQV